VSHFLRLSTLVIFCLAPHIAVAQIDVYQVAVILTYSTLQRR
jgi:NADH:ubiquinone oxidoreductase subunit 6 (subunit J)